MLRTILFASVAVLPLYTAAAQAECTPVTPVDGDIVTCTGTDTNGVDRKNVSNVSVTVDAAAVVTNADDATKHVFRFKNGASFVVAGRVESFGDADAFNLGDDASVTLTAGSHVLSALNDGVQADDRLTFSLTGGTIEAGKKGIKTKADAHIEIASGLITAQGEGIEATDNAYILNKGTIVGLDDGVNVGERATIVNEGTIRSLVDDLGVDYVQDGIDIDSGKITNSGYILSDDDAAIDFDATAYVDEASVITNSGTIAGASGIIVETGHNDDGTLNGEAANTARQEVYNLAGGLIASRGGPALKLGAGADYVRLDAGSELVGDSYLGDDADLLEMSTQAVLSGDVFFGDGNDALTVTDAFSGDLTGFSIATLFDGGDGFDTALFSGYSFADLVSSIWQAAVLDLGFADGTSYRLTNFESFGFSDRTLGASDFPVAAVPVPLSALLLLSGLGGLGALRRMRRR